MLSIRIICVGDLSQQYWRLAANDYLTRVKKQANIIIQNIKESKLNLISSNINIEPNKIIEYLDKNIDYQWMLLDLTGNLVTSEQLAQIIVKNQNYQQGKIGFIIGGSNGVNQELKTNSKLIKIAFGKITLPHQLCYVVLLEQILLFVTNY
ncbi:23S rRNA (pseudouridine(1915)-N(3))-methyltransferase RlmH [Spiroplasma endosymbiont of Nebria brevicollis]|uniref:23S rRNA (pseudouridine(1915)-N(3))-methyltransferase RlmH n=1 Tax=Spiroplasma endosymbiont of Nebria brevicollis TaxID=3066284 RepID=UPI00313EC33E